jgi:hypothetical protein
MSTNVTEYHVRLVSRNYLWQQLSYVFRHVVGDLHSLMYLRCVIFVVVVVDDDDEGVNVPCELNANDDDAVTMETRRSVGVYAYKTAREYWLLLDEIFIEHFMIRLQ